MATILNAADLAMNAGSDISRGDYNRLNEAGIVKISAIEAANDADILACIGSNKQKLRTIRDAVTAFRDNERATTRTSPILPPYQS